MEVDVESHGQRRRCPRRGAPRGPGGPWCHGMPRGGWCGPWGVRISTPRGRFGCNLRGGPPVWPPAAQKSHPAGPSASASAPQPQPMENSEPRDTNVETGEMASGPPLEAAAAAAADSGWTLVVNDGVADVEGARSGVEQLHVATDAAPADPAVPGMCRF